jgi:hypothetical protein
MDVAGTIDLSGRPADPDDPADGSAGTNEIIDSDKEQVP